MIKENQTLLNKLNALSDILILFISMTLAYFIRFYIFSSDGEYIKLIKYTQFTLIIVPINLILYNFLIYIIHLEQLLSKKNLRKFLKPTLY